MKIHNQNLKQKPKGTKKQIFTQWKQTLCILTLYMYNANALWSRNLEKVMESNGILKDQKGTNRI